MKSDARAKSVVVPPSALVEALERMLRAQLDGHQQLFQCITRKRQAIRTADLAAITNICGEENVIVQRLAELEKHRLEVIGRLTESFNPKAAKPLTVSEIAATLQEPQATRLTALAAQLREALADVKRESSIIKSASEALSRHMTGIVQTVHAALSKARVYGNRGTIAIGTQIQSVVDLKS